MTEITTYLLENNHLVNEGLKSILAETNFKVAEVPEYLKDMDCLRDASLNIDLVIFGLDDEIQRLESLIDTLKLSHPASKIAIIGSNLNPEFIQSCFTHGADGYLTKNLSSCLLLNSLSMIMAGEKIYPVVALDNLLKKNKEGAHIAESHLSAREQEILKHLALGETNKEIALKQNIAESTVKAHTKTILRKLNLTNRTQAARWAWKEGLINESTGGVSSYYKQTPSMMLPNPTHHMPRQETR